MRRAVPGLLFLSVLIGRPKEVSYFGMPDNPTQLSAPDPITVVLQGSVLNETSQPAVGISVQVGSKSAVTDSKGYFHIPEAALNKKPQW